VEVERNPLKVKKLSEVLQTSCTPEGQAAVSQDLQTLLGKASALGTWERDPVQSSIQCNEVQSQQPGVSTEELHLVQVSVMSL